MARILTLEQAQALPPGTWDKQQCYNGLDVCGTREVWDTLRPRLNAQQERTYAFERALQAPCLSMMLRGVRVDDVKRRTMVGNLKQEKVREQKALTKLPEIVSVWDVYEKETGDCPTAEARADGRPGKHKWPRGVPDSLVKICERCGASRLKLKEFNPGSFPDKLHLFYDLHRVPKMTNKTGKVSVDDDILEKIGRRYPALRPLTDAIRGLQDLTKQIGTLGAKLTSEGRYPSSFNVGAAWTGRFSSSKNPLGLGGNLQNVTERHRLVFLPDIGYSIGYADYKQGESNIVAHLAGDSKYIEAHLSGDVHTYAARLIWPELGWTGDLKRDKAVAKALPKWDEVEGHDFRFQAKRIQHGSNYGLTPQGISMIAHIPLVQARIAYENYMSEFECIPAWQADVKRRLEDGEPFTNALGRYWQPMGRPWDKHTWRQVLAFLPSSLLADIENIALWRVWRYLEEKAVELLAQVHDAILHQFPAGNLELERELLKLMQVPVPITDIFGKTRIMTIGVEAAIGANWGKKSPVNPRGLDETLIEAYLKDHPL